MSTNHKRTFAVFVILLLSLSAIGVATHEGGDLSGRDDDYTQPRFDEIYYKTIKAIGEAILAFKAGEIDFLPDVATWENKEEVEALGFNTSICEMAEFGYLGINCRNYINDTYDTDVGWIRAPDSRSLSPLNYSSWRTAMHYMIGYEGKEELGAAIYGATFKPLDAVVPPSQAYYHNPDISVPQSCDDAWDILENGIPECCEGGFYVDGGVLYDPYDNEVRPDGAIEIWYSTGHPLLTQLFEGFVKIMNKCFADHGVTRADTEGYLDYPFKPVAVEFGQIVSAILSHPCDFDAIRIGWTNLGRFVDWTYDLFHSDFAGGRGYNYGGFVNPTCDALTEKIMFNLNFTEIREAAFELQERMAYCWNYYIVTDTGYQVGAYGRLLEPGVVRPLENWHAMASYCSDNDWTWNTMHWMDSPTGECQEITRRVSEPPTELDPFFSDELYEWNYLDRIIEGLLTMNPYTHEDLPNVAHNWEVEEWVNETEGVTAGMKLTYYLRDDVYWQDGHQVLSDDVVFNWLMLQKHNAGRYRTAWQNLVRTEPRLCEPGTLTAVAYVNETSPYQVYNYAGMALFYPKHILQIADEYVQNGTWASIHEFQPWTRDYREFTGLEPLEGFEEPEKMEAPGGQYTCLIGSHTYIYDYFDDATSLGHLVKFPNYWKTSAIMWYKHYDGENWLVKIVNQGTKDTSDDWEDEVEGALVEVQDKWDEDNFYNLDFATWHTFIYESDPNPITVSWTRQGDFDFDGDIDQFDFWHFCDAFIDYWSGVGKDPKCDFDNDCDIDQFDFWDFCDSFIDYYA